MKILLLCMNLPLSFSFRWIIHLQITFPWISEMRSLERLQMFLQITVMSIIIITTLPSFIERTGLVRILH